MLAEVWCWEGWAGFCLEGFAGAIHGVLWTLPACALPSQQTCIQTSALSSADDAYHCMGAGRTLLLIACSLCPPPQLPHLLQVDNIYPPYFNYQAILRFSGAF